MSFVYGILHKNIEIVFVLYGCKVQGVIKKIAVYLHYSFGTLTLRIEIGYRTIKPLTIVRVGITIINIKAHVCRFVSNCLPLFLLSVHRLSEEKKQEMAILDFLRQTCDCRENFYRYWRPHDQRNLLLNLLTQS